MKIFPTWRQFKKWHLPSKYSCLSFFLGSLLSGISVYYSVRPDPEVRALSNAIRAEKPTRLEMIEASAIRFIGESGYILSISYRNPSSRPAYDLKIKLSGLHGVIELPSDGIFKSFSSNKIKANANDVTDLLVARVHDIQSALGVGCIEDFTVYPELETNASGVYHLIPFMTETSYETVFEEKNTTNQPIWAVVPDRCS